MAQNVDDIIFKNQFYESGSAPLKVFTWKGNWNRNDEPTTHL